MILCTSTNTAYIYIYEKLIELQRKLDKSTVIVGYFNTTISDTDR